MKYIVNAEKMKIIDQYTIETIGIPAMVLMEQAAMSVAAIMKKTIQKSDRILAVCGMGNNGGDGIAIARILQEHGYHTTIMMVGDETRISEQTRQQLRIAENLGVNRINKGQISEYNVVIDAIFGIGLSKPVTGEFEQIIREINHSHKLVYAVDIPSGISADSGHIMNVAVKADVTVTFGVNKQGMVLYPGCMYAGEIIVADIGFPGESVTYANPTTFTFEEQDLGRLPNRMSYSNKGTYGKVLVIAGSKNMSGACFLSAKAAYRTGAGLVRIVTAEENRIVLQTNLPEAILTTYQTEHMEKGKDTEEILEAIAWASVIVIGPGIGVSATANELLNIVLQNSKVPVIVDADAINLLASNKQYQNENGRLEILDNIILTPHLKEMSRLTKQPVNEIAENLIDSAVGLIEGTKSVCVLKDARSVVTNGSQVYINMSGNNGMATGGSGDVLTGIIAGLIAQGMNLFEAAALGVYIHGLAGDYVVKNGNCYSLIASDLIEVLPKVLDYKGDMTR